LKPIFFWASFFRAGSRCRLRLACLPPIGWTGTPYLCRHPIPPRYCP
jgi:hypothetical protein